MSSFHSHGRMRLLWPSSFYAFCSRPGCSLAASRPTHQRPYYFEHNNHSALVPRLLSAVTDSRPSPRINLSCAHTHIALFALLCASCRFLRLSTCCVSLASSAAYLGFGPNSFSPKHLSLAASARISWYQDRGGAKRYPPPDAVELFSAIAV